MPTILDTVETQEQIFEVTPDDSGVDFLINNSIGYGMTADQAEAFGIALVLAAYRSREMNKNV